MGAEAVTSKRLDGTDLGRWMMEVHDRRLMADASCSPGAGNEKGECSTGAPSAPIERLWHERRRERVVSPMVSGPTISGRLRWRVVVRTEGHLDPSRATRPLAWHLVGCPDPARADAHCVEGCRLLSAGGDPEGHCLIDGACPRCAAARVAGQAPELAAPVTPSPTWKGVEREQAGVQVGLPLSVPRSLRTTLPRLLQVLDEHLDPLVGPAGSE